MGNKFFSEDLSEVSLNLEDIVVVRRTFKIFKFLIASCWYDIRCPAVVVPCTTLKVYTICLHRCFQEHQSLVMKHKCCEWLVHQCINCNTYTHATRAKPGDEGHILVNSGLLVSHHRCDLLDLYFIVEYRNFPEETKF